MDCLSYYYDIRQPAWNPISSVAQGKKPDSFTPRMRRKQSLPVRFTLEQENTIARIAETNGISRAEVVRLAVIQFLAQLDESGELTVARVIKAPGPPESGTKARRKNESLA